MALPRVLLTGPVDNLDEWCDAARAAGWEPVAWPLIEIRGRAPEANWHAQLAAEGPPDHLCITSAHAVLFLDASALLHPVLRGLPCSVVGERSRALLHSHRFGGAIHVHASADELAEVLLARTPCPARVLWPRGDKSDELARRLRAAGITVLDPIAYENRPRTRAEPPPETDVVFFASPSAVEAWTELAPRHAAVRALAIGTTTMHALLSGKSLAFPDIISLPEATSSAFSAALSHVDLRSQP